jgi:MFS family permease
LTTHVLRRNPTLRRIFASTAVSLVGTELTLLALPIFAIKSLNATTFQVAVLGALEYVPFMVIALFAGAIMDRRRRRPVMLATDIARAVVLASIPLAWAFGALTLAHMYIAVTIMGAATVFFDISSGSFLPDVVDDEDLIAANGSFGVAENLAMTGGPALAGLLLRLLSAPLVILGDATSYLVSALFVWRIPRDAEWPAPKVAAGSSVRADIKVGTSFVFNHRELRPILVAAAAGNLASHVLAGVLNVYMFRTLAFSPLRIGVVYAVSAAGALFAATVAEKLSRRFGLGPTFVLFISAPVVGTLLIWSAESWSPTAGLAIGMGVCGVGSGGGNVLQVSYRSAVTPAALRGRMNATFRTICYGVIPIGFLLGGLVGSVFNARTAVLLASVISAIGLLTIMRSAAAHIAGMPALGDALDARLDMTAGNKVGSQIGAPSVEVGAAHGSSGGGERQLPHVYRWNEMKMHMWDLIPRNDDADAFALEDPLLREADALARHYQMLGQDLGKIDPVINLDPGHHQDMAGRHRVDRQEPDTMLVTPNKRSGDFAVDDTGKDGSHA